MFNKEVLRGQAVIYIRVSTEEQVDNYSLDSQLQACEKEAIKRGLDVIKVFREEGHSAKTDKRPALIEALEYCRKSQKKVTNLIFYRIDRLARNSTDYGLIKRKLSGYGISLVSVSEPIGNTPAEVAMETVMAAFAQLDNDIRAERATNGLRSRFLDGWKIGKPPLGYKPGKDGEKEIVENDPKSFTKVKDAWTLMATGTKTLSEITEIMNDWGLKTYWKGAYHKIRTQSASRIFSNKFYMGVLSSPKYPEEVIGKHEAMITEETFYKVQSIIKGRTVNASAMKFNVDNEDFPLRRIAKCLCGSSLTGGFSRGEQGKRYGYYFCFNRCEFAKNYSTTKLEQVIVDLLREIQPSPETLKFFTIKLRRNYYSKIDSLKRKRSEAQMKIQELKDLRKALVKGHALGKYTDEELAEQKEEIESELIGYSVIGNNANIEKYDIEALIAFMLNIFHDLGNAFLHASLSQKRFLLSSIFPSGIQVYNYETSNLEISPLFQAIQNATSTSKSTGAGEGDRTPYVHFGKVTFYR